MVRKPIAALERTHGVLNIIIIHWQVTLYLLFFAINMANKEGKEKIRKKVLLGKGNWFLRQREMCSLKGQLTLEPFFAIDFLGLCLFSSGRWTIAYSCSQKLTVLHTHTLCTCISSFPTWTWFFGFPVVGRIQPMRNSMNFPFSFRFSFLKLTSQPIRVWQQNNNKAKYCWLIFCTNSRKKMNILPLNLYIYASNKLKLSLSTK